MPRVTLIQIRNGTAASWTTANPVLALGEAGFETDTRKTKVGDGATAWTSLAYSDANASDLTTGTLAAARLPASGVTAATYGSATQVSQIAVDASGRVTSATNVTITGGGATTDASALTSGTLAVARLPALTGDVTSTVNTATTSIAANAVVTAKINDAAVTNAKLANMAAYTYKMNNSASAAGPADTTAVGLTADNSPASTKLVITHDPATGAMTKTALSGLPAPSSALTAASVAGTGVGALFIATYVSGNGSIPRGTVGTALSGSNSTFGGLTTVSIVGAVAGSIFTCLGAPQDGVNYLVIRTA